MICFLAAIVTSAFGAQSIDYFDSTNSELTCLVKQSFLVISTDIRSLFKEYLCPPGRRFGIIKPLTLTSIPQRNEECFCSEIMV